ncbi:MAG: metallophosphoesterase, partial [Oscillospiraceae bacterium]|nr:metallophosphoesterase [Oscillospiraceae bacterium]
SEVADSEDTDSEVADSEDTDSEVADSEDVSEIILTSNGLVLGSSSSSSDSEADGSEEDADTEEDTLTADDVQEMINSLPDTSDITEDNAEEVEALLDAIDEARASIGEEADYLDYTKYDDACDALATLEGQESGEPETIEESSSYQVANSFVSGQNYIIGIQSGDKFYAVGNNGGTIVAVATDITNPDESVIWTANGSERFSLCNSNIYLYYSTTELKSNSSEKSNWTFASGVLKYIAGGDTYYAGTVSGSGFACAKNDDSVAVTYVIYTSGSDLGTASSGGDDSGDSGEGGSSDSSTSLTYTASTTVTGNVSFVVNGYSFGIEMGQIQVVSASVSDAGLTVTTSNYLTATAVDGGFTLSVEDPPGTVAYLVVSNGALSKDSSSSGYWTYTNGVLAYTVDSTTYYISGASADGVTVTTDAASAAALNLYTGTSTPSKGGDGGSSSSTETDADAPVIVTQPVAVGYVYVDSGYEAPVYTIEAQLPEGSTSTGIYFVWYVDDVVVYESGKISCSAGEIVSSTYTGTNLQGLDVGVYTVYCEAYCNVVDDSTGERVAHSIDSHKVSFIVCSGVKANSFLTFSDVHETFTNIGVAINDTITTYGGLIPALIICTGDWANGHYTGTSEENINTTLNDYIAAIMAQVGGIDIVFVSGNHDNSIAAATATAESNLADTTDFEEDGVGVIYDSGYESEDVGTSAENTGLVVFGINYEALEQSDGSYSYATVLPQLEAFLEDLSKNYQGQLVVISAHAGLHVLDSWSGENSYNVDMSADMVKLLNKYATEYNMDIMYFFGHDHSKGEQEFYLTSGSTITSTVSYSSQTYEDITLAFTYAHAGYITNTIGGEENYTLVTWDTETIVRSMYVADGTHSLNDSLSFELDRVAEIPDEPVDQPDEPTPPAGDDKPSEPGGDKPGDDKNAPKTGDESNVLVWLIVLAVCGAGTVAIILPHKKRG